MTGPEKLDICFSVIFNLYYQIFTSENETGHTALLLPNFDFFLIFTNFLSSEVLSCSATRVGIVYNVFILDIGTVLLVLLGTLILKIMAKNETFISETKNNQNWKLSNLAYYLIFPLASSKCWKKLLIGYM